MISILRKLTKFADIYDITESMSSKEKGDLFEHFVYHLFKLDSRLNNKLQNIWLYSDVPTDVIAELDLPDRDLGIDLIALIDNEYCAIQCKFRQNTNMTVSWKELSTFFGLSFGINDKIKRGYFVTNTDDVCNEVTRSEKVIAITGDYFNVLDDVFFKNIDAKQIVYQSKKPFSYQRECIDKSFKRLIFSSRCHVEMACGTGKSLMAYWLDSTMNNYKTIIFVPSLQLLSQFYSDWINQSYAERVPINYLLIGSDADVDDDVKQKAQGLLLFTDPKVIRSHLQDKYLVFKDEKLFVPQKLVVICTYQSTSKLMEASEDVKYDFAIFDEAHKTVGVEGKQFGLALSDDNIVIKKRFFMTATPKFYKGKVDKEKVTSMNDEEIYGKKVFTFNTGDAIEKKRLVDYQVLSLIATDNEIANDIRDNKLVSIKDDLKDMPASYLGCILILLKKLHDGTMKHLITYHNKVKHAKTFAKYLEIVNYKLYEDKIFIDYLDGRDTMNKRKRVLKSFADSEIGVISSARVLNEGVNVPIIDSLCFVDVRMGTIDIIQCIGRTLRLHPEKKLATIIVPTQIKDFDEEFDNETYGNLIHILKALKNTDTSIVEYFSLKKEGKKCLREICRMEYYEEKKIEVKKINLEEWHEKIETKLWSVVDYWSYMYKRVKTWIDEHDKLPYKESKNKLERELGTWCHNTKRQYRIKQLNHDRITKLESLTSWTWPKSTTIAKTFDEKYEELRQFIHDHKRLPVSSAKNKIEKSLHRFCDGVRQLQKKGKLKKHVYNRMNQLDMWFWTKIISFETKFEQLKEWLIEHKRSPNKSSKNKIERSLGNFCSDQRKFYKKGKLSKDRILLLKSLPISVLELENKFDIIFEELKKWINNNNRLPISHSTNSDEKRLGNFCTHRRKYYANKKISQYQIDKFESLGEIWWWSEDEKFENKLTELKQWIQKNNRVPTVRTKNSIEKKLGYFCADKRSRYKRGWLSKHVIEKLEAAFDDHWWE